MLKNIEIYVILFAIYAVLGWIMEVILGLIQHKKFVNRGFLIGPYCPIYGFGCLAITLLLSNFITTIGNTSIVDNIWISTIIIMVICGLLEYLTSYIMEKLFHARWWDYHRFKFNINGRICLETLVPFTLIGQIILRYGSPNFISLIQQIPNAELHITSIIILLIFIADISISYNLIHSFKKISNEVKDNTEEITSKVKEILSKTWAGRRLVQAFPNVDVLKEKIKQRVEEKKEKIENKKQEIKQIVENKIRK